MHKVSGASTKVYWGDGESQEIHCSWLVSENRPISFQFNRIISRLCGCEAVVHCTHKSTEYTLVPCKSVLNNQIVIGRNSFANRIMPLWFIFIPWCSRVSPSYPPSQLCGVSIQCALPCVAHIRVSEKIEPIFQSNKFLFGGPAICKMIAINSINFSCASDTSVCLLYSQFISIRATLISVSVCTLYTNHSTIFIACNYGLNEFPIKLHTSHLP